MRLFLAGVAFLYWIQSAVAVGEGRPLRRGQDVSTEDPQPDVVGDVDGRWDEPHKALMDTLWIATWTFDGPGGCDGAGWETVDNRIIANGQLHWTVESSFAGMGGIAGNAATLGYSGSNCCIDADGYDNDWYEAIRLPYVGTATLSFDYLVDSEAGFDYLQVETDSACASLARVDYDVDPASTAAAYRTVVFSADGLDLAGAVAGLGLTAFGPGTHCVYIAFFSDSGVSPCDGGLGLPVPSTLGRALVVDNLELTDAGGTTSQDFEGPVDPGLFVELHDTTPFGEWARLYRHITDNDTCTENTTCAWLWTDHTTPTIANDASMAFAPNGYVVRNWLDDIIVSPWVSLPSMPLPVETVLRFRRFAGNPFNSGRIVAGWSVRGRRVVGGQTCVSAWGHAFSFNSLNTFRWLTTTAAMSASFAPGSEAIQIRHRVVDRQWIAGSGPPSPYRPGPGPFVDDFRIGQILVYGPVLSEGLDARSQAQDCFPTEIHPGIAPGTGEHHRPTTDRFGTCAFSAGGDLGSGIWQNIITGDSVTVSVQDVRMAGGITAVEWHGAIVAGPHAGKAPAPYVVGSSGFFAVSADSARTWNGQVVAGRFYVDLDDTYFRGGDVLHSCWLATDALGGTTSNPPGLLGPPSSPEDAERLTGGLFEVSFLPAIDWAPPYLARIATDPHGDLAPTAAEIAGSSQAHCILYVNHHNARRRSGAINRTRFMYTLDRLGYGYDVYDHSGMGNTNNHLGGRATVPQATGYSVIVYDAGDAAAGRPIMPGGSNNDTQKVDQAGWFRAWLAQAATSVAGRATLWVIGSNACEESPTLPLYNQDMATVLVQTSQTAATNPMVLGQTAFAFATGSGPAVVDFTVGDRAEFVLATSCAGLRGYDGLAPAGTGVVTYRYANAAGATTDAGLVMNASPAGRWNTILQSHPWSHLYDPTGSPPTDPGPAHDLAAAILSAVTGCAPASPVGVPGAPTLDMPLRTLLYPNVPNPFNPTTEIRFDLARGGAVTLQIFTVTGRLVCTLVDRPMPAGYGQRAIWNGLDATGAPVPTGVYWARLVAPDRVETRKMLLLQ